eukprot:CAMPEP_0179146820 /NCGR_PEP_ID=MMETSP0796-20121207/70931_1 /TAXON_ID=73915 /ORGANISM="Pyrodinium bahamense, Strain pbaha01" /LENGTH=44 /DNA_ID= /DNA_START= /DNA_END= /DNA_ORIENTATION=
MCQLKGTEQLTALQRLAATSDGRPWSGANSSLGLYAEVSRVAPC